MEIQPDIHVKAEEKSLFELVTLLVDNANKYCDAGGTVSVKLSKANRLSKARLKFPIPTSKARTLIIANSLNVFTVKMNHIITKNQVMVSDCQWHRPWLNSSKEALAFLIAEIPLHS